MSDRVPQALHPFRDPLQQEMRRRLIPVSRLLAAHIPGISPSPWFEAITFLLHQPESLLQSPLITTEQSFSEETTGLFALHATLAFAVASQTNLIGVAEKHWAAGIPLAAALEALRCTLDLWDDMQDGDQPKVLGERSLPTAIGGIALTMILLADERLAPSVAQPLIRRLGAALFSSAEGQFLDVLYEHLPTVTLNDALAMTTLKSGSLIRAVYALSAYAGAASRVSEAEALELGDAFGTFGMHLGTYWQLVNDLRDAQPDSPKSDRQRGKKTLPLVQEAHLHASATAEQRLHAGQVTAMLACDLAKRQAQVALTHLAQAFGCDISWLLWIVG